MAASHGQLRNSNLPRYQHSPETHRNRYQRPEIKDKIFLKVGRAAGLSSGSSCFLVLCLRVLAFMTRAACAARSA